MSQVPKLHKWHAHWIVYIYILSIAGRAAIAYTIWSHKGFVHITVNPMTAAVIETEVKKKTRIDIKLS